MIQKIDATLTDNVKQYYFHNSIILLCDVPVIFIFLNKMSHVRKPDNPFLRMCKTTPSICREYIVNSKMTFSKNMLGKWMQAITELAVGIPAFPFEY